MSSKKWCIAAVFAVILAVGAIIAFNVKEDPFGVFGDEWYSYNETNNPRVAKIEYLKKNHDKYDSYIIGCSSTSSYPVEDLNRYMGARFYNMIMYGADMLDVEQTVYYLANNYEVKNIVLNVYIANGFNYDYEPNKITDSMHYLADGSSRTKFYAKYAFLNPQYSYAKLEAKKKDRYLAEPFDVFDEETGAYDKRKRDAEHISDMESYYEAYPIFANYPTGEYLLSKFSENGNSLMRIKEFCESKGIKLIVVNAPIYYEYFKCIPDYDIEHFYKTIAESVDFWDFSVSSVSLEPRYFYDETHFRNSIGKMALARIFGDDSIYIPEDFGKYITKDNVEEQVQTFYGKTFSDMEYTKRLPILLYHHIAENVENDMIVSPKRFEEHMRAIAENGYTALTLDDVLAYIEKGEDLPEKAVLITLDDGYMSNYSIAYPILEKYGLHGVIFAVGSTFGSDTYKDTGIKIFEHFGKDEMRKMEESGIIDVESHTYDMHQNADYEKGAAAEDVLIHEGESDEDYVRRVTEDCRMWEEKLGKKAKALAFPHGVSDLFSQAILDSCGIKLTFSTNAKIDTLIKGLPQSGYAMGRYTVTESMSAEDILSLLK